MTNWLREFGHLLHLDRVRGPWREHPINLKRSKMNFNDSQLQIDFNGFSYSISYGTSSTLLLPYKETT
jgi:hypothetical protein